MSIKRTYLKICFKTAMDELDGDDVRLESRGKKAVRDIVQVCVAFNTHFLHKLYFQLKYYFRDDQTRFFL